MLFDASSRIFPILQGLYCSQNQPPFRMKLGTQNLSSTSVWLETLNKNILLYCVQVALEHCTLRFLVLFLCRVIKNFNIIPRLKMKCCCHYFLIEIPLLQTEKTLCIKPSVWVQKCHSCIISQKEKSYSFAGSFCLLAILDRRLLPFVEGP